VTVTLRELTQLGLIVTEPLLVFAVTLKVTVPLPVSERVAGVI